MGIPSLSSSTAVSSVNAVQAAQGEDANQQALANAVAAFEAALAAAQKDPSNQLLAQQLRDAGIKLSDAETACAKSPLQVDKDAAAAFEEDTGTNLDALIAACVTDKGQGLPADVMNIVDTFAVGGSAFTTYEDNIVPGLAAFLTTYPANQQ